MTKLSYFRNVCRGGLVACLFGAFSQAFAESPMWVIEDDDSTIYLFGTVHLLQPDNEWLTGSVQAALTRADEIWFEVPMLEDLEAMQQQLAPIFMRAALSPHKPLSSRLNSEEKERLAAAVGRTAHPQQIGMALENMKPWFAVLQLAKGPLQASGYNAQDGMDVVLSRIAHEKGTPVRGFETFEQQVGFFSQGSDADQMGALRTLLNTPDADVRLETKVSDMAFDHWLDGDPELLDLLMGAWRERPYPERASVSYEIMVRDRNADWAQQIEEMLADDGVTFIAVGAGHLVGPDNLRAMLASRGIEARKL